MIGPMAALLVMLGLCPGDVVTLKLTSPADIRQYVPESGWREFNFGGGRGFIGADSIVTICACEVPPNGK